MPIRIDKLNNIWARFVWLGKSETESTYANPMGYLDGHFSIYTPNYQFDPRFKNRRITRYDGKHHIFKKELGTLPLGLVQEAYTLLKNSYFEVSIDKKIKESFLNPLYNEEEVNDFALSISCDLKDTLGYMPYDFQIKALHKAIKSKRVLFESPTGSGKSLTMYLILQYLLKLHAENKDFKILLLVPNRVLVTQLYRDFKDYGWKNIEDHVGMFDSDFTKQEKIEALKKTVLISTIDSIDGLISKKEDFGSLFNVIMLDEAHRAKDPKESKRLTRVLTAFENAEYRYGLTGTIPKNLLFEKSLEGSFGKKTILAETAKLQEEGVLSDCKIFKVEIPYETESIKFLKVNKIKYPEEVELARLNKSKHYAISQLIKNGNIKKTDNTLILCNKVENGEIQDIVDHLKKHHKEFDVEVIHGGIKGKARDKIITSINDREGVIVIATYATMSTGVNIKKLHNCIFASSMQSFESIIQSIGRILRTHKSKDMAYIYDLVDMLEIKTRSGGMWRSYLNKHWVTRESYYAEKKFKIETIKLDKTFSLLNIDYDLSI